MNFGLLHGLIRVRVALVVAGLAWFLGITPDLPSRLVLAVLVLAALGFDGWLDEQRIRHMASKVPPQRDRHYTAA